MLWPRRTCHCAREGAREAERRRRRSAGQDAVLAHGVHRHAAAPHTNLMVVTLDTSHAEMGWLNASAKENIPAPHMNPISVTLDTSHAEMGWLNSEAPPNIPLRERGRARGREEEATLGESGCGVLAHGDHRARSSATHELHVRNFGHIPRRNGLIKRFGVVEQSTARERARARQRGGGDAR